MKSPQESKSSRSKPLKSRFKNVASNLMAYWFDPLHQPTPILMQASQQNAGMLFSHGIGSKAPAGQRQTGRAT